MSTVEGYEIYPNEDKCIPTINNCDGPFVFTPIEGLRAEVKEDGKIFEKNIYSKKIDVDVNNRYIKTNKTRDEKIGPITVAKYPVFRLASTNEISQSDSLLGGNRRRRKTRNPKRKRGKKSSRRSRKH